MYGLILAGSTVPVLAETASTVADVTTAMTTAITTMAGNGMDAIAAIVPVAAPILGAFIVVRIGIRAFKQFTGR